MGLTEIALIEHEIDDVQHARQALGKIAALGDIVRNARVADLRLRPYDALRQRRGGGEKRRRDLLRRQAAHLAQRHRDLRVRIQGGVAAGEDEAQPVVGDGVILGFCKLLRHVYLIADLATALAHPVDRLESARRNEPRPRIRRCPFDRPALERRRERILKRLLGEIEVAEQADQGGEDAAGFRAVDRLERYWPQTGRTSMEPHLAEGMRAATWMASFRSLASIRK